SSRVMSFFFFLSSSTRYARPTRNGSSLVCSSDLEPAPGRADHQAAEARPVPRTPYYTREMHPYQAELVLRMLRRIEAIREQIAHLAAIYLEAFRGTPIATFLPPGCDNGGLMRFPIAFPGKGRSAILRRALKRGLY